ncbi:MAG: cytochrome bc complex cytochrome b subunit [Syntrophorhabdaceae bacterium]|nr:cytochrome bc complex cytochrome b subunit [Syntrophorhabdaceae bacterium]MDD4196196.1 cytochrome bc complex cytochrome b subunit [Syntrophorhabdaceae bacterium]
MISRKLEDWITERYDIKGLGRLLRAKYVPSHCLDASYFTGGLTLFLFIVQFLTGMGLALYYVPHSEYAYKSIVDIMTKLNMGWFFRSLHHWGAQLAIASLFVHFFANLLLKAYRKPRELLWVTGFIMIIVLVFFGLSGYFLIWDQRAFTAIRVATGGAGNLPLIGGPIKVFLRGGIDVTQETLTRFYALHVAILPMISLIIIGLHVLLVQVHGMSVPVSQKDKQGQPQPFFPNVFYKDLIIWFLATGIIVTLAVLLPAGIGTKADPMAPAPENIKPEWYFLFVFQTLKLFPGQMAGFNGETIAMTVISLSVLFVLLVPFLDKRSSAGKPSLAYTCIGVFYLLYFVAMTIIGFLN